MKRSEMIDLLLSKLHHLELGTDDSIIEESEFKLAEYAHASQVLEFLEEVGMAPPEVTEPVTQHVVDQFGRILHEDVAKVYVRKWNDEA